MSDSAAAEQAMRRVCDLVLAGDYMTAMGDVTPEALNHVMNFGAGMMNLPAPEGYDLEADGVEDGQHRFRIRFIAQAQELHATVGLQEIDGGWKISSVSDVKVA